MKRKNLIAKTKIHKNLLKHLDKRNYKNIYSKFEIFLNKNNINSFVVAVSGGVDSLALVFLAKCYQLKNSSKIFFVHIDHSLRQSSSEEADFLNKNLKRFDIDCKIIKWKKSKKIQGSQANARKFRYKALQEFCKTNKIENIILAHHLDDLYENFFIRMIRGSGLKGLVSFSDSKSTSNEGITYLRPFLGYSKKILSKITNTIFGFNINDPSNYNPKYLRTRVRNIIKNFNQEGFDRKKFNLTINNLISSNNTINYYVSKNLLENSKSLIFNNSNSIILKSEFFSHPREVVFRSLSNIILSLNNNYYPTRGKSLIKQIDLINNKKFRKTTIGGCIIERVQKSTIIYAEKLK
jgi:tRNA(Ile)-lysidine synthase